jgi:hypothetical protein
LLGATKRLAVGPLIARFTLKKYILPIFISTIIIACCKTAVSPADKNNTEKPSITKSDTSRIKTVDNYSMIHIVSTTTNTLIFITQTKTLFPWLNDQIIENDIKLEDVILFENDIPLQNDDYPAMFWAYNIRPEYLILKPKETKLCLIDCISGRWTEDIETLILTLSLTKSESESILQVNNLKAELFLDPRSIEIV